MAKKRKPRKLKVPEVRLTGAMRCTLIAHIKDMIEEVMSESDIWRIIDEHVQTEYARDGYARLECEHNPPQVMCSIGSGDAVFSLELDVEQDVDDRPTDPQQDNKIRLQGIDVLLSALAEQRQRLTAAIKQSEEL